MSLPRTSTGTSTTAPAPPIAAAGTPTAERKGRRILDAERRTGRKVTVAYIYRYAPPAAHIRQLLMNDPIGPVTSVDSHGYLASRHGADYFRRWHAYRRNSGTLWVHK